MSNSRSHLGAAQILLLVLGFGLLVIGAYTPTIARAVNAYYAQAVINVGGGTPTSLTLGITSFDYIQCPTCTSKYQEVQFGNTFQLSGQITPSTNNLQISTTFQVNTGVTPGFLQYFTDSQGYYGALSNGGQPTNPALIQLKPDGIYISGASGKFGVTINVGDTVTFKATVSSVSSNTVQVKIVGSGIPPTGTVTLKGGDGQTFTLDASSNVATTSPLCFRVAITQGLDNVQSITLPYWHYGVQELNSLPLTRNAPVCGLPSDPNSWYGQLNLQPGTYVVKVNIIPKQGQPIVLLSILGYFDVPNSQPQDYSYYVGLFIMVIGSVVAVGGAFLPTGRRMP